MTKALKNRPHSTRLDKEQTQHIREIIKRYPNIFVNESHFIRCAINYFARSIRKGEFKITAFEVE